MKKITAILLSMVLVLGLFGVPAFAADTSVEVYVSIAIDDGTVAVAQEKVRVTDIDSDGKLTINDALFCAHEAFYPGGASQGYQTEVTQWGLGILKLWNITNGGSYGYYVNNASAWSLTDTLVAGDYVNAFVYQDAQGFSDSYAYFSETTVSATAFESFDVTLYRLAFDADWNTVQTPVAGAKITVDGAKTNFVTDADGKATVTLTETGSHVISAQSDSIIIAAPVCKVEVGPADFMSAVLHYLQVAFRVMRLILAFVLNLVGLAA